MIVFLFILIINCSQKNQYNAIQYVQEDQLLPFLKDGDIICRLGDSLWSLVFKDLSPVEKRFSHLGIVRIKDGYVSVIHAEGLTKINEDRVSEVPLSDFLKSARSAGIYRLNINEIDGALISDTALEYIGRPFDWQFDMQKDDKIYCSELLFLVLSRINPGICLNTMWVKELNRYIIPVDICSQAEYFTEIGYFLPTMQKNANLF